MNGEKPVAFVKPAGKESYVMMMSMNAPLVLVFMLPIAPTLLALLNVTAKTVGPVKNAIKISTNVLKICVKTVHFVPTL